MPNVQPFPAGGYRFISHQFQYSGGVAAELGFRIERARFERPLPVAEGFDAIEAYLAGIGRSPTALCACEPGGGRISAETSDLEWGHQRCPPECIPARCNIMRTDGITLA